MKYRAYVLYLFADGTLGEVTKTVNSKTIARQYLQGFIDWVAAHHRELIKAEIQEISA